MNQRQGMRPQAPLEPVLDMDDIQGIAVPGFFKPYQTLLYLTLPADSRETVDHFKTWIGNFATQVSSAQKTLQDRRDHRQKGTRPASKRANEAAILFAIAFSAIGLRKLTPGAGDIPSPAFQQGLVARSALLGDPTDPNVPGHPSTWTVGAPGAEIDSLIVVAGNDPDPVSEHAAKLSAQLREAGVKVDTEDGSVRSDLPGHEHFGFDDGVSQPGIRGRASADPHNFVTARHVAPGEIPEAWLYGYPGQDLVWPGEFVLGYATTSPDPLIPGPPSEAKPAWTRNGSFLVYRRLLQDVGLFWRTMRDEAARLATLPGFAGLDDQRLASLLVGRWPSGAPLLRVPMKDDPGLGAEQLANNYFQFDSDTAPLKLTAPVKNYPSAKADPVGLTCPLAAHIRKVNTRDAPSDMGGRSATYERRILRVGVPFGPPLPEAQKYATLDEDPVHGKRGLLFLGIQSSIEDQFEFLQARWINDEARPKAPSGNDIVVGQNTPARNGIRRCSLFGSGFAQAEIRAAGQFVVPSGGGYFFVPSLSALGDVLAK
jgi:Dyp-type peroxidase family